MSSQIITCKCGSKVRLPEGQRRESLLCPNCKAPLALTANATVLTTKMLGSGQPTLCPICQTVIDPNESCVTCPRCDQVHHSECWSAVGGCGTYGCEEAPAIETSESNSETPLTAWGDTKKCPACGEEIKSIALRCRYCSTEFNTVDPMSISDLRQNFIVGDELETLRKIVVAFFVLSLLGCLAPLLAIVSTSYLLPRRDKLAKCGPLFAIMGWTSIVLSAVYTALLILFFLFDQV